MKEKKLPGAAELYGIKVVVDESLPKYSNHEFFRKKVEEANAIIDKIVNLDEVLGRKPSENK